MVHGIQDTAVIFSQTLGITIITIQIITMDVTGKMVTKFATRERVISL